MLLAALQAGCDIHQAGHEEPIEPPGQFSDGGSAPVPDRWWRAFDDPRLNELQRRALEGNFGLGAARDRLRAARAVVDRETALDFPELDLSVNAQSRREQNTDFEPTDQLGADLVAQYEVDLWNRIESGIERTEFQRDATRESLKAAGITLTANVSSAWYALVEQRGQRRILEQQIETNETVLEIVRKRFGRGLVRASDVLRQERLLESTREQLESVRSEIKILKHQLLELTGRSPTERLAGSRDELPELPPKPETGLPSELLHRRPDVRAAFYDVRSADRAIAVAIADRYPRLTLSVSAAVSDEKPAELFDNWIQQLAADVVTPLVDFGRRKAEVRRTQAVKRERIDQYGQTMLVALREVSNALSRETHLREQLRLIRHQLDLAERTYERLRREYLNGDISYIDVLDSLTRQQQLQRDLLRTRFQLINNRISLYRALAGGWEGLIASPGEQQQTARDGEAPENGADKGTSSEAGSAGDESTKDGPVEEGAASSAGGSAGQ